MLQHARAHACARGQVAEAKGKEAVAEQHHDAKLQTSAMSAWHTQVLCCAGPGRAGPGQHAGAARRGAVRYGAVQGSVVRGGHEVARCGAWCVPVWACAGVCAFVRARGLELEGVELEALGPERARTCGAADLAVLSYNITQGAGRLGLEG